MAQGGYTMSTEVLSLVITCLHIPSKLWLWASTTYCVFSVPLPNSINYILSFDLPALGPNWGSKTPSDLDLMGVRCQRAISHLQYLYNSVPERLLVKNRPTMLLRWSVPHPLSEITHWPAYCSYSVGRRKAHANSKQTLHYLYFMKVVDFGNTKMHFGFKTVKTRSMKTNKVEWPVCL